MKGKASVFLKQIISVLSCMARSKSMALKSKMSTTKARLIMLSLMKNKKVLMGSISEKIHGLLRHRQHDNESESEEEQSKAIVLYNAMSRNSNNIEMEEQLMEDDEDDKYPDLRHTLFDEEDLEELENGGGSVIEMVRNSKEEGEKFSLEDEIDHVADLFITKFHKQMRLQKLLSFKRYQEMLQRSL